MNMRVLITGGSGFVASHVVSQCLKRGYKVYLQTRTKRALDLWTSNNITILEGSFLSLEPSVLRGVDSIIHLASAGVSPRSAGWGELEHINIVGVRHMCSLAKETGAKVVVAGSYAEYGRSGMRYDEIPVDAPMEPTFPYAVSKAAGCQLALGFARAEGLKMAYLRIFNAFGQGQHESNLWPSLIRAAISGQDYEMTKGEQIRDFVDVEYVARQFIDAATCHSLKESAPLVSNVGSGTPQTVQQFCEYWWSQFDAKGTLKVGCLPYRENEVMRYIPCMKSAYL